MENTNGKEVNIFDQGILVSLSVGRWRGSKRLEAKDLDKSEMDIPDNVNLGTKKQVSTKAFSDFNNIHNRAKKLLHQYTIPFPIDGVYFIPNSYIEQVVKAMKDFQLKYSEASDYFVAVNYQEEKDEMRNKYPKQFNEWDYPNLYTPRNKFYFRYQIFKLDMGTGNYLSEDDILQQRQTMKAQMSEFAEMYGRALRQEILKFAGTLSNKFNSGEIFKQNSINNVLDFCDRFDNGLNFLNDKGVSTAVNQLRSILNGNDDAEAIRDDVDVKRQLGSEIQNVVSEIDKQMKSINSSASDYGRKLVF